MLESFRPGALDRLGVGWDRIHDRKPEIALVSLTPFGQDSPYRDYKLTDLTLYGMCGEMYSMGVADAEPMKMYGTAALVQCGASAAAAAMAALTVSETQGLGQHVDLALADIQFNGTDRRHATQIGNQFSGRKSLRAPGGGFQILGGVYHCADGYVMFVGAAQHLDRVRAMLGNPAWIEDPKWDAPGVQLDPDAVGEFQAYFLPWCLERSKRDIWALAREHRVLCGPLFTVDELYADEHFRGRDFFTALDHPDLGRVEAPGRAVLMRVHALGDHAARAPARSAHPRGSRRGRPRRRRDRGADRRRRGGRGRSRRVVTAPRPLEGVRVLDLCVVWAGTYATCILADLGAEVIKLENVHVFAPMTRGPRARPPREMMTGNIAWATGYPNSEPGPRPWNYCPTFVQLYRNTEERHDRPHQRPRQGAACGRSSRRAMSSSRTTRSGRREKLGLDYDALRAIKPDIIMLRAPGYGLTGPYRHARTLGAHLESVTGHTLLRGGYPDRDPSQTSAIFAGDHMAGSQGAFAIMAALRHRRRTGEGQLIEMAQAEAAAPMVAQAYMHQALLGSPPAPVGNHSIYGFAPHNLYPCRSPGDAGDGGDRWIAITVTSDDEWRALRAEMGAPAWADASLDTNAARLARQDEIDVHIAAWTRDHDDYDLFHRLQRAGVPAAPVLEASRVFDDPHVRARETQLAADAPGRPGPLPVQQPPVPIPRHAAASRAPGRGAGAGQRLRLHGADRPFHGPVPGHRRRRRRGNRLRPGYRLNGPDRYPRSQADGGR